ncbi:lycopene cyclase domain-containing protein [Agromyces laixinhei]|uniref:lycopene cyclase domain-containing protein n=1 Tax=Agromyces laixinhei TaxID=2585717 RepID=UPI0012ED459B|nr:lycopene cyclase domain-containing protein [Agromyces laixinhei]
MSFVYLGVLLGAIACMVLLDLRFRLVFAADGRRAAIVLTAGVAFFLLWDLAGIALGIFYRAENAVSTGILLALELPLEEVVFLIFLCYLTLVLYTSALRVITAYERRHQ